MAGGHGGLGAWVVMEGGFTPFIGKGKREGKQKDIDSPREVNPSARREVRGGRLVLQGGPMSWRDEGGVARARMAGKGGGVAAGACTRRVEAAGRCSKATRRVWGGKPRRTAVPLFQRTKEEEGEGRVVFVIF